MSTRSLLPDNRTPLEIALEQTLSDSLLALECPYPQLWSPTDIAAGLLPYLAHAKGVTDWGGEADEAAQRHTVANVWPVQRRAGTKQGVEDAVSGLGVQAEYMPGYRWGGPAYSFRVDIRGLRGVPVTRVMQRINSAKSERDGYSVRVVYEPEQALFLGGAVHQSPRIAIHYQLPRQTIAPTQLALGGAVHQSPRVAIHYQPPVQHTTPAQRTLGGAVHQAPRVSIGYRPAQQAVQRARRYTGTLVHQSPQLAVNYQPAAQTITATVLRAAGAVHQSAAQQISYQPPTVALTAGAITGRVVHIARHITIS